MRSRESYTSRGDAWALFGQNKTHAKLSAEWTSHFQKMKAQCISVVNANGLLDIDWPNMLDGHPADFDIILATATKPEAKPPAAQAIADAWLAQSTGNENYFFNNVRHGIRTPDDTAIWRRMEEQSSRWISTEAYKSAIAILREEAKAHELS